MGIGWLHPACLLLPHLTWPPDLDPICAVSFRHVVSFWSRALTLTVWISTLVHVVCPSSPEGPGAWAANFIRETLVFLQLLSLHSLIPLMSHQLSTECCFPTPASAWSSEWPVNRRQERRVPLPLSALPELSVCPRYSDLYRVFSVGILIQRGIFCFLHRWEAVCLEKELGKTKTRMIRRFLLI